MSSIDLIYLDPPFNSNRSYNVLFKEENGEEAQSQITAFEDTWHWGADAERIYHEFIERARQSCDDARSVARVHRRESDDGVLGDDDGALDRIASRVETDRQHLFALRPDGKPLCENCDGYDLWSTKL